MSETEDARPVPRLRAWLDQPAPDAGAPVPAVPAARRARALMQLNTRITPELNDVIALAMDRWGLSKRATVEAALRAAYPDEVRTVERRLRGL
ncbi:hypothetical protein [Streptomyces nitrosporeus]|uniref:hypothetical protein n=1 Tax=Streptomyces nitrosporeus TaxID=28894 RepID=UPI00167D7BA1|nr:hypothetical protein [Streptomyces nitrosporeus]GGZ30475.1 hypothetical protein GCM10010327_70720 [Streptomyces nitrosporeus]